jgi:hypothetical protein
MPVGLEDFFSSPTPMALAAHLAEQQSALFATPLHTRWDTHIDLFQEKGPVNVTGKNGE